MKSPKVVALVEELAKLRTVKGLTVDELRQKLNEHLASPISNDKTGNAQVDRWIHPRRKGWVCPGGEIVLAMQQTIKQSLVNEKP